MADRWARLAGWLGPRLGATGSVHLREEGGPASIGYSAETVVFTAQYDRVERKLVLRAETPDPPVYPPQAPELDVEIDIQRRVMEAVAAHSGVPLAPIVGTEPDSAVIGTPFFVMEFVEGQVPTVDPPYIKAGFFVEARPADRMTMLTDGLGVLADIHRIDWERAGLAWLVPPGTAPTLERQLEIWHACATSDLGERRHPDMEAAYDLLRRHLPAGSPPALCWGDPRPGNMIWRNWRCVCVTDWEAASISPPELDLGWWLMFDRCSHEVEGVPRLEGEPSREEQLQLYASAASWHLRDPGLHELFAAYRYCAIVVRVMNRAVERGQLPADHTIWLDNPATTALRQLLAE